MSRIKMWGLAIVAGWLMSAGVGWSADAPATSTVVGKGHHANQDKLRGLIDELLPTLRSHRDTAKKLVESGSTRASL